MNTSTMNRTVMIVHPSFDLEWPFAGDHLRALLQGQGDIEFTRLAHEDQRRLGELAVQPETIERLFTFGIPVTEACTASMTGLKEAVLYSYQEEQELGRITEGLAQRGVRYYTLKSEGFWGQSVSEFGLALTLCGLRRIPQTHGEILQSLAPWDYMPPGGIGAPGARGVQFGDDPRFVSGTVAGKRVRIVGAGNIASRYASFMSMLGADVAAWDPFASEPCFHRTGARRVHYLEELVKDADIFAPMVPLLPKTEGLVHAGLINALPAGSLVVLVTRSGIVDMEALRRRVLADELSLAADVFDVEPLPLDDPLLGRSNVVHTPHNAGRTIHANQQLAQALFDQLLPRG